MDKTTANNRTAAYNGNTTIGDTTNTAIVNETANKPWNTNTNIANQRTAKRNKSNWGDAENAMSTKIETTI